ncbi:MAG: hypothetical protein ACK55Z_36100 [bacterium]
MPARDAATRAMVAGGAACRRCKAVTGPLKADVSTGWLSRRPTAAKWRIPGL